MPSFTATLISAVTRMIRMNLIEVPPWSLNRWNPSWTVVCHPKEAWEVFLASVFPIFLPNSSEPGYFFPIRCSASASLPLIPVNWHLACCLLYPESPSKWRLDVPHEDNKLRDVFRVSCAGAIVLLPRELVSWCFLIIWDQSPKLPSSCECLTVSCRVLRVSFILSWAGEGWGGEWLPEWSGFELFLIMLGEVKIFYISQFVWSVCVSDQFGESVDLA